MPWPAEPERSLEDYLSPFAPPKAQAAGRSARLSWEDGPFVNSESPPLHSSSEYQMKEETLAVEVAEAEDEEQYEVETESGIAFEDGATSWKSEDESWSGEREAAAATSASMEGLLDQVTELERLSEQMEVGSQQLEAGPATESDISDVINIGRGLRRLRQRIGSALSVGPPSSTADTSAAVPPFNFLARLNMPVPILDAAANAQAIQWNNRQHPGRSGIDPQHIRADICRYVNLTAVASAIQRFNAANPTKAIQSGTAPMDAVLVEAIHQFQAKCFFETAQIDGKAGESTLDSLGLVRRTGLNSVDRRNTGAHNRLGKVDVPGLTNSEFTADTWFDHMVNPSFLGWRFTQGGTPRGVHLSFMRKLRVAERALLALPRLSGKTPVELGKALGFSATSEEHKGARPTATTVSMHTYGLAVDIKYTGNPWVRGAHFLTALQHAALLMSGFRITQTTSQRFLHALGADANLTTAAIFDILAQRDRDFRNYLALASNPAGLTATLTQRRAVGTAGVFTSATETIATAATRWQNHIQTDLRNMRAQASPFRTDSGGLRNPLLGFLNLDRDLVIALRDTACLAWGAVDFGSGSGGSGDIMHFDDRVCGIGHELAVRGGNTPPRSGHPCIACPPPAASSEISEAFEDFEAENFEGENFEAEDFEAEDFQAEEFEALQSDEDSEAEEVQFEDEEEATWETESDETWTPREDPREEAFLGDLGRLLNPGAILTRVKELLGEGLFAASVLGRFGSGQLWNEDQLALEVLFHRQPKLRPADFDRLTGSARLRRIFSLAIKLQRALTPIREQVIRPIFGRPANFQIGLAQGCRVQDLREDVRKLGPLKGGEMNGKPWYKRAASASPRKAERVDSIVLHHMAFNRGNLASSYLKVGAHYAVLADGQILQLYDDLDFLNASDGFNPRSVAVELAGNFPSLSYDWWKDSTSTIPDRCYLTPAQIQAARCLLSTLKTRWSGIKYIYAHRQSSRSRASDPGPDAWFMLGEWAITSLGLTDRLPKTHIGKGQPIPDSWRTTRGAVATRPAPRTSVAKTRVPVPGR